jgi:Rrf2 family protein
MELSAKSRYAAAILLELATCGEKGRLSASALAGHLGVSAQFVEQVLKPLKKSGLVDSVRGAAGGYHLAGPAGKITLGGIVRVMEGGVNFTVCRGERVHECPRMDACPSFHVWENIGRELEKSLDSLTLDDLLNDRYLCPGKAQDKGASAPAP